MRSHVHCFICWGLFVGLHLLIPTAEAQSIRPLFQSLGDPGNGPANAAFVRAMQRPTTRRAATVQADRTVFNEDRVILNPFPELRLEATRNDIGFSGARHRTWFGNLADDQGSAVFIINGDRISGKINSTRGTFEVFPLENGGCVVVEHEPGAFPECGTDNLSVSQRVRAANPELLPLPSDSDDVGEPGLSGDGPTGDDSAGDTPTGNRIRVLVAYTTSARSKTQTTYGRTMQEHIDLAIAESNQGYANSGVTLRIELACLYQTGFIETTAIENDVDDFQSNGDGKGDEVHQFRNDYDADMCCLLTDGRDTDWCGWAYGFTYTSSANMFQATSYSCATGNFTLAHEFGHTQGCRHNDDSSLTPFAYGHGFRNGNNWRTIMGLSNDTGAARLNYWSNPNINSPVSPFTAMGTAVNGGNFANDCRTALNVSDGTVVNHQATPATSTAPTDDVFDNDEYADKVVTGTLTVGAFTANSGSQIQFRAGSSIVLQPGFRARVGSEFRARLTSPLGDPAVDAETFPVAVSQDEAVQTIKPSAL